jgi:hypothetical protein
MKSLMELQKAYRQLNKNLIETYEHEVREQRKEEKEKSSLRPQHDNLQKKLLADAGFNIKKIEQEEEKDEKAFLKKLVDNRKKFVNRKPGRSLELQDRDLFAQILKEGKGNLLSHFGTCIMAPDGKFVDHIKGERGNPWVFPDDPSKIDLWTSGHIGGWRCLQAYAAPPPPTANVWFHFVPDRTGRWDFSAIAAFHGFYILRSNDSWYNCRYAWVKLSATVKVYQYSWQNPRNYTLLYKRETNNDYIRSFDSTEWMDTSAYLRAGDDTWILLTITVDAMSEGTGTWAELNFANGNANYILPLLVAAFPPAG